MNALIPVLFFFAQIVGGEFTHTVATGDSLAGIGARYGVDVRVLAEANSLKPSEPLEPGQALWIDNRHIAWRSDQADIVINLPQRMLFHFEQDHVTSSYPISAGKPDWRTPLGDFEVMSKEEAPTWDVPTSIQEEMRRAGKPVVSRVPPSPANPLGEYWIGLSLPAIGIHGTNAPSSIYKLVTHGCIRLHPEDVQNLFSEVDVGMRVRIIYEPVLMAKMENTVYLEVHPNVYKAESDPFRRAVYLASFGGFLDMVDLARVEEVIRKHDGIARDVTRR